MGRTAYGFGGLGGGRCAAVAIAVVPEPPREDRWSRFERAVFGALVVVTVVLFVFGMLDHYVF